MTVLDESLLLGAPAAASSYQISRSLRFNSADSAYLSRTPASAGNRTTWTWAGWVKRSGPFGAVSVYHAFFGVLNTGNSRRDGFRFNDDGDIDKLQIFFDNLAGCNLKTSAVFRDPSAWYHIVVAADTTQSVASDRIKVYVNGSQVTQFSTATYPAQNYQCYINNNSLTHYIGREGNADYFPGYLADIHFIDGQALTPSSFGAFDANNVWQPKAYSGSYGTNGFKLDFADNSNNTAATLGKDTSGNGNNWTPTNLSVTAGSGNDSLVDSPTNYGTDTGAGGEVRGNYATLNPLVGGTNFSQITLSNGNLDAVWAGTTNYATVLGTIGASSGKWYWEVTAVAAAAIIGVAKDPVDLANYVGAQSGSYSYYSATGNTYNNTTATAYGNTYTAGDVIGIALDLDNGKVFFSKNGTWQNSGSPTGGTGAAFTGLSGTFYPALSDGTSTATSSYSCNFGQRPFAYTAPSGYKALCTQNLPTPTILNGATAMDVKLYTGNGGSQSITGLGFSPDLVWVKTRSATAYYHALYDTVRGAGTTKSLYSNGTEAEGTYSTYTNLTSFDSNGFSLGATTNNNILNQSGQTFVGWCWDAGSSTVTNTQGSITSSVRANATAGFSIVSYTSVGTSGTIDTVGHGLGVSPSMVIAKNRDLADGWYVLRSDFSNPVRDYLQLNTTAAKATVGADAWSFSSTTVGIRQASIASASNQKIVLYCFAPVSGYSAFGSYTGNGSADGPFVFTGFRPRWLLIKSSSGATENWVLIDAARDTYNVAGTYLLPNLSDAESSSLPVDFLSNGFKLRGSGGTNQSAVTYVYAAFAENPFTISRAR